MEAEADKLMMAIGAVANRLDTDIYIYSGAIDRASATALIEEYSQAAHRKNCVLILTTHGGMPTQHIS